MEIAASLLGLLSSGRVSALPAITVLAVLRLGRVRQSPMDHLLLDAAILSTLVLTSSRKRVYVNLMRSN